MEKEGGRPNCRQEMILWIDAVQKQYRTFGGMVGHNGWIFLSSAMIVYNGGTLSDNLFVDPDLDWGYTNNNILRNGGGVRIWIWNGRYRLF